MPKNVYCICGAHIAVIPASEEVSMPVCSGTGHREPLEFRRVRLCGLIETITIYQPDYPAYPVFRKTKKLVSSRLSPKRYLLAKFWSRWWLTLRG